MEDFGIFNKVKNLLLVFLFLFIFLGAAFALSGTITSVTFSPDSGTLKIGNSTELRVAIGSGTVYGVCSINGLPASGHDGGGAIHFVYTVSENDTDRSVNGLPISCTFCDDGGMSVGCVSDTTPDGGTPGVDAHRPYATSFSYGDNYLKNGQSTTVTVNFSEQILNISEDDFTNAYASFSGAICSNATECAYTMTISSAGNYTGQTISLNGSLYTDLAGNNASNQTSAQTFTIDNTPPTLSSITMSDYSLKAGESTTVYFTFSDASSSVGGFGDSDITHPNISDSVSVSGSGLSYSATFTANAIHDESNEISIGTGWYDLADNSAVSSGSPSANYTITPPYALSATFNANEGSRVLTITFDETMDASDTDLSKIYVRQSGSATGGVVLTGATVTNSDSTIITITTTEAQRILIKALAATYGASNLEVDLDAGAVQEYDLSFANEADVDNDISYTTDTTKPLISSVTADDSTLTEADVGSGQLVLTTVFNEAMDTLVYPVIELLPDVSSTLNCSGSWSNATTFLYTCDVSDDNITESNIDVRVTGAKDVNTDNQMLPDTEADIFSIDTVKPVVSTLSVNDTWVGEDTVGASAFVVTVNFAETMNTGINPGISFIPAVSSTLSCGGVWSDSDTYTYSCDVNDSEIEQANIDIRITNAKDLVGNNMETYTESDEFNVDMIKPTISVSDDASVAWTNSDTITSSPADGLGINNTKWLVRNNSTCDSSLDATFTASGTSATSVTANVEGTYYNKYICFRTVDNAGNKRYVSSSQIAKLDTSVPVTSISGNTCSSWTNVAQSITLSCSGLNSGCANTYYRIGGSGEFSTYSSAFSVSDGNNLIEYYSVDNASNTEITKVNCAAQDLVKPTTTGAVGFTADGNNGWYITDANYVLTPGDATSGVNGTYYCKDTTNACSPVSGDTNYSTAITISTESATNYVRFRSIDNANNTQITQSSGIIKLDKTNPAVSISGNTYLSWTNANQTITLTPTDATSGVVLTTYRIDSGDWTEYSAPFVVSTDGNHQIDYNTLDASGRTSGIQTSYIAVDKTKPVTTGAITAGTLGSNSWYTTNVTYTITPSDATSGVNGTYYCVDTNNTCTPTAGDTNYSTAITISTESATNYVRFRSIDNANNLQDINSSGAIKIDLNNPTTDGNITSGTQADNNWYTTDVNFTLYPADATSGFVDTNYCVDTNNTCVPDTNYVSPIVLNADGNNYVRFRTIDASGRTQTTQSSGLIQIDETPPVISVTGTSTTSTIILSVTTNEDSNCRYDTSSLKAYADMNSVLDSNKIRTYSWPTITGLSSNTAYTFYIQCRNEVLFDTNLTITVTTQQVNGAQTYTSGTTTVSSVSRSLDYNVAGIREALTDMVDDQNKPLYSSTQIDNIVKNSGDYEFNRTVVVEKIVLTTGSIRYKVTVNTSVKNKTSGDLKNVKVVVEVPKSITSSASDIQSLIPFTTIVDDPIIEFNLSSLRAGETANIEYNVTRIAAVDANKITFSDPVIRSATKVIIPSTTTEVPSNNSIEELPIQDTQTQETVNSTPMDYTLPIAVLLIVLIVVGGAYVVMSKKNNKKLRY